MLITWIIGVLLLYFPFKKWVATSKAPFLSALVWPLIVGIFVVPISLGLIIGGIKKISGGEK